jgi:uncharacterized protein (TIGR00725 family)
MNPVENKVDFRLLLCGVSSIGCISIKDNTGEYKLARIPVIAVVGAGSATEEVLEIAKSVGEAISERGFHLVCGGKQGVMAAVCQGFRFARNELNTTRALAIGVLPEDTSDFANEFVDLALPTGIGIARNALITRMADGIVSVGGGSGTLSELAYAWQMKKPIAAMVTSGGWSSRLAGERIDDSRVEPIFSAVSAHEALAYLTARMDETE